MTAEDRAISVWGDLYETDDCETEFIYKVTQAIEQYAAEQTAELRKQVKRLEEALANPPRHRYWGAGEPDCPKEIKAGNGELHTLMCKVCGEKYPTSEVCLAVLAATAPTQKEVNDD